MPSGVESKTPESRLARLLCELFVAEGELRRWLLGRPDTRELNPELPFGPSPIDDAFGVVQALQSRGLLDAAFWEDLVRDRPGHRAQIQAIAKEFTELHPAPPVDLLPPSPLRPLPDEPYPLLRPYEHPALLGGRQADIEHLLMLLGRDRVVWTLHASSGAGKSSLLRAGLLPALWGQTGRPPQPVAFDAQPASVGLVSRLLGQLVRSPPVVADGEHERFAALFAQICRVAGARPVLVLDQFEEVFGTEALRWLGPLLAATALHPGGPVARWVLAYRREFHGQVEDWLEDHRRYAPDSSGEVPHLDLSQERHQSWPLPLLGDARGSADPLAAATAAFEDAISRPLALLGSDGAPRYPIPFSAEDRHRLALAFARVRVANPHDPQTPELQVVLHRLLAKQPVLVPAEPTATDAILADAIGAHLREKLDAVAGRGDPRGIRERRTAAILLMGRLVDEAGRRAPLPMDRLEGKLKGPARDLLVALQRPGVWLIRQELVDHKPCATLPHDRVASEVFRITQDAAEIVRYDLDPRLVERWRLVTQRAAAWQGGDAAAATLSGRLFRELVRGQRSLPWDQGTRAWWAAVEAARARVVLRWTGVFAAAAVLLAVFLGVVGVYLNVKGNERDVRSLSAVTGEPLRALHRLQATYGYDGEELAAVLGDFDADKRDEIFGLGPIGLSDEERQEIIPPLVVALADQVEGDPSPESFYGALLASAAAVRPSEESAKESVISAMRKARGEPVRPDPADGSWSPVIAGTFSVGCFPDAADACEADEDLHPVTLSPYRMKLTEETLAEYRAFAPDFQAGRPDDWPVLGENWYEALAYAAWRGGALPTEAQWEVAARGGRAADYRQTAWYSGNEEADLARVGLYVGNQREVFATLGGRRMMTATESAAIFSEDHPLGLVAIHGNQVEWTADWYAEYPAELQIDPSGPVVPPPDAAGRVLRGGSWNDSAALARSAFRGRNQPANRNLTVGFRLVLPQPVGTGS